MSLVFVTMKVREQDSLLDALGTAAGGGFDAVQDDSTCPWCNPNEWGQFADEAVWFLTSGSMGERDTVQLAMEIEPIDSLRHEPGYLPSNMPWPAAQSINQPEFARTAKKVLELTIYDDCAKMSVELVLDLH